MLVYSSVPTTPELGGLALSMPVMTLMTRSSPPCAVFTRIYRNFRHSWLHPHLHPQNRPLARISLPRRCVFSQMFSSRERIPTRHLHSMTAVVCILSPLPTLLITELTRDTPSSGGFISKVVRPHSVLIVFCDFSSW